MSLENKEQELLTSKMKGDQIKRTPTFVSGNYLPKRLLPWIFSNFPRQPYTTRYYTACI